MPINKLLDQSEKLLFVMDEINLPIEPTDERIDKNGKQKKNIVCDLLAIKKTRIDRRRFF